jgi:hypothetical protein
MAWSGVFKTELVEVAARFGGISSKAACRDDSMPG